jgi:broad specificity phosphatase PhoE
MSKVDIREGWTAHLPGTAAIALHIRPAGRARETAEIICNFIDATPIEPLIREVSIGLWDGLTHTDIHAG